MLFNLKMFPSIRLCLVAFALAGTAWVINSSPAVAQGDVPCFDDCHDAAMEQYRRGVFMDEINEDYFDCLGNC